MEKEDEAARLHAEVEELMREVAIEEANARRKQEVAERELEVSRETCWGRKVYSISAVQVCGRMGCGKGGLLCWVAAGCCCVLLLCVQSALLGLV